MQIERTIEYFTNKGIAPNIARTLSFLVLDGIETYSNKIKTNKAGDYTRKQYKELNKLIREIK